MKIFDINKPYKRCDGRDAKIIHVLNRDTGRENYVVVSTDPEGEEFSYVVDVEGRCYNTIDLEDDLVNEPVQTRFMVILSSDLYGRVNFSSVDQIAPYYTNFPYTRGLCAIEVEMRPNDAGVDRVIAVHPIQFETFGKDHK